MKEETVVEVELTSVQKAYYRCVMFVCGVWHPFVHVCVCLLCDCVGIILSIIYVSLY